MHPKITPLGDGSRPATGDYRRSRRKRDEEAAQAAQGATEHLAQRAAAEAASGKKKRGRKPKSVQPLPPAEAKANVTDPDSRVMKTRQGYVQGYNVQAVVSEDQIIVAVGVTQEANDKHQLLPMLEKLSENLQAAGIAERPRAVLGDAGYWSEANVTVGSRPEGPELLIATTKDWKQRKAARERGCPRGRIPEGLSPRERRERKLLTQRGRRLYKLHGVLVEPVFGQVKEGQAFRRFMRRGLAAAPILSGRSSSGSPIILKLWRSGQAPWGWATAQWN